MSKFMNKLKKPTKIKCGLNFLKTTDKGLSVFNGGLRTVKSLYQNQVA